MCVRVVGVEGRRGWIESKKPNKNSQRYNGEKKQCKKLGTENRIT